MKTANQARMLSMAALALLVSGVFAAHDVEARETRASARSGSAPQASRNFSRQGAASNGSFTNIERSRTTTTTTRQTTQKGAISDNQSQRQSASSDNQAQRQESRTTNQGQRQDAVNENVETRQTGATARQQNRVTQYPAGYRHPAGYYPPPGYYHDDDDWDTGSAVAGFVAGAVVGAVITDAANDSAPATSAPPPAPAANPAPVAQAGLPCAPAVSTINGVTYYSCGNAYYMQAYGPSGPVYMPVQPPVK